MISTSFFIIIKSLLSGGGDLLFLLSPPAAAPPLVSALTQKYLLGLFPNICSMHTGPGEFAW